MTCIRMCVILFSRRNDMPNVIFPENTIIVCIEKVFCLHCMKNTSIDYYHCYTYPNNQSDRFLGFVY